MCCKSIAWNYLVKVVWDFFSLEEGNSNMMRSVCIERKLSCFRRIKELHPLLYTASIENSSCAISFCFNIRWNYLRIHATHVWRWKTERRNKKYFRWDMSRDQYFRDISELRSRVNSKCTRRDNNFVQNCSTLSVSGPNCDVSINLSNLDIYMVDCIAYFKQDTTLA